MRAGLRHLAILSTTVGTLDIFPLDADRPVPGWYLGGLSLWSFLESP